MSWGVVCLCLIFRSIVQLRIVALRVPVVQQVVIHQVPAPALHSNSIGTIFYQKWTAWILLQVKFPDTGKIKLENTKTIKIVQQRNRQLGKNETAPQHLYGLF